MKRQLLLMTMIIIMIGLFTAGCAKEETPQKLRIGVMSDIGAAPFIIAQEKGYFKELGLEVDLTVFKSATDRDTAMQTGNLDGAMADMLTIVFYNDAKFGAKMVSQTYGSYVMVTSPTVKKQELETLNPIKVGISANTVIDFVTDQIAVNNNFKDAIETVAIPQMPIRLEMLNAGELNAATLPEPLASAAVIGGGEVVKGTLDLGLQPGIFILTDAAIDSNSDAIEKFYEAYNKGVDYLNTEDQSSYIQLLIDQLGFPPSLDTSFEFPELSHAQIADEVTFRTVLSWMKERSLTTSDYSFNELATDKFIK